MSAPASFTGDWVTVDHPQYKEALHRWAANAERNAKIVAFVKTPQDVATAIAYAKSEKLPIAVRGGGHSASGASSVEGGLVVDLSRYLADVKVDVEKKLAYVGGGAVWGTVDKAAIEHGLATVGGTVNHTGVGGLILGGGYGFLTGAHGLALDNMVQVTLVTADGTILKVNKQENPELLWALKGAGSNFGVVTEFVMQLHPQRKTVFAGIALFPGTALPALMKELHAWYAKGLLAKEAIFHALTRGPDGNAMNILIMFYNGSEEEGRAHFKKFFDIGPFLDLVKEVPYEVLNTLQNQGVPHGKNYYMKGVFVSEPIVEVADELMDNIMKVSKELDLSVSFIFEYLPTAKVLSVPPEESCHIRGSRVSCVCFASWDGSSDKLPVVRQSIGEAIDIILKSEKTLDAATNTGYGNYITEDPSQLKSGSRTSADNLFGANYSRLQELKRKYDPELIFSKWCPIAV